MSSSSQAGDSWISAFCSLVGHEYFAEVSEDFIEDDFNLTGLQSQVPMYKEALEMILDVEPETDEYTGDDDEDEEEEEASLNSDDQSMRDTTGQNGAPGGAGYSRAAERRHARMASDYSVIESSAEMLYGLIHQRFITSRQGIQQMLEKYEIGHFGSCPRVYCRGAKVLPVGTSDIPGHDTVKLFCPACLDVYAPPNSRFQTVDGAFFGTTFGCLFFMTFPELDVAGTRVLENPAASSTPHAGSSAAAGGQNGEAEGADLRGSGRNGARTARERERDEGLNINGVASHNLAPGLGTGNIYEPRIYGFRVSEFAKTGPRMKWLRQRPESLQDLDEVAMWENTRVAGDAAAQRGLEEDDGDAGEEMDDDEGILEGEEEEGIVEDDEEEDEDVGEAKEMSGGVVDVGSGRGKKARHRGANGDLSGLG